MKVFNLAFNQIEHIDGNVFTQLVSLETLDIRYNKLNSLPLEMTSARNLKSLLLTGNLMIELPCFLKEMNLTEVQHEWVALCNDEVSSQIFSKTCSSDEYDLASWKHSAMSVGVVFQQMILLHNKGISHLTFMDYLDLVSNLISSRS